MNSPEQKPVKALPTRAMQKEDAQQRSDIDYLIGQIATGDERALADLFSVFGERLFRYACRLTQAEEVAKEVTNDVLRAVWESAHGFQRRSKASTWLLGITRNVAINAIRGKTIATQDIDLVPEPVDEDLDASELVLAKDHKAIKEAIKRGLRKLSLEHRDVLELTFYHQCSYTDIAEIVGCPVSTVRTRMFYAKKQLRHELRKDDVDSELQTWLNVKIHG